MFFSRKSKKFFLNELKDSFKVTKKFILKELKGFF